MRHRLAALPCVWLAVVGATADAAPAQIREPMVRIKPQPYDTVAGCLMTELESSDAAAWRMVYPAPRTEALVMLWPAGMVGGNPAVIIFVRQDRVGNISIRYAGAKAGYFGKLALAAATRCGV